jgi:hypothetical protein
MGWRFRRGINIGPVRINLGRRGAGVSVGAGPVRVGRSASGKDYASVNIPGTGVSYRKESTAARGKGTGGCFGLLMLSIAAAASSALAIFCIA